MADEWLTIAVTVSLRAMIPKVQFKHSGKLLLLKPLF